MTDVGELLARVRTIAVVGCSTDPFKPAHSVPRQMQAAGYRIVPVNPNHAGQVVLGEPCYASLADVPEPVDLVNVFRRSEHTPEVVRAAVAAGAPAVWLQSGITHPESRRIAEEAGIGYIEDRCIAVERSRLRIRHD